MDDLIGKKGPKYGIRLRLEWQRKARATLKHNGSGGGVMWVGACHMRAFSKKSMHALFLFKLVSRVMGNLPARFGEH